MHPLPVHLPAFRLSSPTYDYTFIVSQVLLNQHNAELQWIQKPEFINSTVNHQAVGGHLIAISTNKDS